MSKYIIIFEGVSNSNRTLLLNELIKIIKENYPSANFYDEGLMIHSKRNDILKIIEINEVKIGIESRLEKTGNRISYLNIQDMINEFQCNLIICSAPANLTGIYRNIKNLVVRDNYTIINEKELQFDKNVDSIKYNKLKAKYLFDLIKELQIL